MNARKLASRLVASLAVLMVLSTLSGCVVEARPRPVRVYYRR